MATVLSAGEVEQLLRPQKMQLEQWRRLRELIKSPQGAMSPEAEAIRTSLVGANRGQIASIADKILPSTGYGDAAARYLATGADTVAKGLPAIYNPTLAEQQMRSLAAMGEMFPKTLSMLRGFEPVTQAVKNGGVTIAHYDPLAQGNWLLGIRPQHSPYTAGTPEALAQSYNHAIETGWHPIPNLGTVDPTIAHEFTHALDTRATAFTDKPFTRKMIDATREWDKFKADVLERSLRGEKIPFGMPGSQESTMLPEAGYGYATSAASNRLKELGVVPEAYDAFGMKAAELSPAHLGRAGLTQAAREPLAEAFVRDPTIFQEPLNALKAAGFEGSAAPGILGLGAAGLGAQLLLPKVIPGTAGHIAADAATGAALGGMTGNPWAALGGGVLGAGAGVLRHFL